MKARFEVNLSAAARLPALVFSSAAFLDTSGVGAILDRRAADADDPTFRSDLSVNVAAQQRRHQFPHREVAGATEYDHVERRDRQQPVGVRTRYRHSVIPSLWDSILQRA
jgi:hypothetical protein